MTSRAQRIVLGLVLVTSSWLLGLAPLSLFAARLPEPLASHWSFAGRPNGALSTAALAAMVVVPNLAATASLLWAWGRRSVARGAVLVMALSVFLAHTLSAVAAGIVWLNLDRVTWREAAGMDHWLLLAILAWPTLIAGGALAAGFRWAPAEVSLRGGSMLRLYPHERAHWSGTAHNHWLLVLAASLTLPLAVVPNRPLSLVVASLFAAGLCASFARIRVTVDHKGVRVRYAGLWCQEVPIERITNARTIEVVPWSHGGWGYRGSLWLMGRASLVIRRGPGLELGLESGKRFVVTVDDAETAAALVAGLVEQRSERLLANAAVPSRMQLPHA